MILFSAPTHSWSPEIYLKEMAQFEISGSIETSNFNKCPTFLMIGSSSKLFIDPNAKLSLSSDGGLIITDNTTLKLWSTSKRTYLGHRTRCVVDSPGKQVEVSGINCTGVVDFAHDECKDLPLSYDPDFDFQYDKNKTYEFPEGIQCFYLGSPSQCEQWNAKVDAIRIDKGYKANCNATAQINRNFCFST